MTFNSVWLRRAGYALLVFCALNVLFGLVFAGVAIWGSPGRRALALAEAILSFGLAAVNALLGTGLAVWSRRQG